jgi:hypothetical protein
MAYLLLSKSDFENPNLKKLAEHWNNDNETEALGCVAWMLHNAQNAEIETCDWPTLINLMPPYSNSEALVADLIQFGFIVAISSSEYRIEGMQRQLTSVRRSRGGKARKHVAADVVEQSKSVGVATRSRRERRHPTSSAVTPIITVSQVSELDKMNSESEPPSASLLEIKYTIPDGSRVNDQSTILPDVDQLEIPDAGHSETQLVVAKKRKTKEKVISVEDARLRMPTPFVWNAYKDAFVARYGREPIRDAKVNSIIRRLVERIGLDLSERLVPYFIRRDDAFYVNAGHEIGLCLLHCQKLVIDMESGSVTTLDSAKRLERVSENDRAVREYLTTTDVGGGT